MVFNLNPRGSKFAPRGELKNWSLTCGVPDGELDSSSGHQGAGRQLLERGAVIALKQRTQKIISIKAKRTLQLFMAGVSA
jgi:hypothetical protein